MITCVIVANNRPDYLAHTLAAVREHHPELEPVIVNDTHHRGMAANIQDAWTAALQSDFTHLLHLEDDMLLLRPLPLDDAAHTLVRDTSLAQITFKREPWWGLEVELGDQLAAIVSLSEHSTEYPTYTTHDHIFSLNPCVIPRPIVEAGWPPGNEAEKTAQLRQAGYRFAMWGSISDPPYVRHIGHERGLGWRL